MSNRKRKKKSMRLEEYDLRFSKTGDEFYSVNRSGEILSTYVRHKPPLDMWLNNGLPQGLYQAGVKYGQIWRDTCRPKSPPHSDSTRIVVDGAGAVPDALPAGDSRELRAAQAVIRDEETITALNRLCGIEDWPVGDKRRFKRICKHGLKRLWEHWRR